MSMAPDMIRITRDMLFVCSKAGYLSGSGALAEALLAGGAIGQQDIVGGHCMHPDYIKVQLLGVSQRRFWLVDVKSVDRACQSWSICHSMRQYRYRTSPLPQRTDCSTTSYIVVLDTIFGRLPLLSRPLATRASCAWAWPRWTFCTFTTPPRRSWLRWAGPPSCGAWRRRSQRATSCGARERYGENRLLAMPDLVIAETLAVLPAARIIGIY